MKHSHRLLETSYSTGTVYVDFLLAHDDSKSEDLPHKSFSSIYVGIHRPIKTHKNAELLTHINQSDRFVIRDTKFGFGSANGGTKHATQKRRRVVVYTKKCLTSLCKTSTPSGNFKNRLRSSGKHAVAHQLDRIRRLVRP